MQLWHRSGQGGGGGVIKQSTGEFERGELEGREGRGREGEEGRRREIDSARNGWRYHKEGRQQ